MLETPPIQIGEGSLGGKGKGIVRVIEAIAALKADGTDAALAERIAVPRTAFLATDIYRDFIAHNEFEALIAQTKTAEAIDTETIAPRFLGGQFPQPIVAALQKLLKQFEKPLAVRSSSLLEDQKGASFAGKYESVFVANTGSPQERLEALLAAITTVYASTFNPNALAYRRKHGFLDDREEMAIVIQEVVGQSFGRYFFPALSGVGFSQNGYCWNKNIKKHDGLVRLVFGLGTRAVGRGYVRLFSPPAPEMRPEGNEVNNIQKCSQKKVDVIDLEKGCFASVHFRKLITDGFTCPPGTQLFVSLRDGGYLYRPVSNLWDSSHVPVLTLDGVLSGMWMGINVPKTLGWILRELETRMGCAIDMEFAIDVDSQKQRANIFIVQARPLSERENQKPEPIPKLPANDILFTVHRNLPTATVPDIDLLVAVNETRYHEWPADDRQSVARVIGALNDLLAKKRFALIGPGRWGSWNPQLGVPVSYAEIAGTVLLIEVARRKATYVPEVSFGSHFFQDLIEDNIAYLPLYPDEPNETFNEKILQLPSCFPTLLPDPYFRKFDELITVIDVAAQAGGRKAHAILNGETEEAIVFLR